MERGCADCYRHLPCGSFSNNQWKRGVGVSRCKTCVLNGGPVDNYRKVPDTARENNSTRATFTTYDLEHPFAQGTFRWVAKGTYVKGGRKGQPCVCKWFKKKVAVYEDVYYALDIKASEKATDILREWNSAGIINKHIQLNRPEVWTFEKNTYWAGQKVLQEPFIENWKKFNSNTGWALTDADWPQVMQALSHFSYHASSGQFVLCDLQGGIYDKGAVLTDPVILSRSQQYGVTDLGPIGISSFFAHHRCNKFCRQHWQQPRDRTAYYPKRKGTSMESEPAYHAPTHPSKPPMTAIAEDSDDDYDYYS